MWSILGIVLLVLFNAVFVAAEFALVKIRGTRITQLVNEGNKRAKLAQHVTENLDAYLSACQLGITLASLGLGWVGEPAIAHMIVEPLLQKLNASEALVHPISLAVAFIVITVLHIVLGELAPKSIAIAKAEGTALWLSGPLMFFYRTAYPAIWVLNGLANLFLKLFRIQPANEQDSGHTEEEIRILMKESQKSGFINENELQLVENVFDFSDRLAREVMIPRTMMSCLYTDNTFEENLEIIATSGHSRFPLATEDKDYIIGYVMARELYQAALRQDRDATDLISLKKDIPYVPESMEVSQVLRVMQRSKVQMVVVADEFGGTAGIITMEDLVEEIFGDIQDELKVEEPDFEQVGDHYIVDGRLLLEKVNEMFAIDIEEDEIDTIGGWIFDQLAEQPQVGQTIVYGHIQFEIIEVEQLRIHRIRVREVEPSDLVEDAS
ncbi:hemolysin family protein [Gorillibacterium massiliense]|uniref:hemolysin family protein n=1 Tax=Gorillibacterium massiliense TaxID=1280390 RepID=UPI0004B9E5DD|nr:hemolysin family protein [Gorillibacterium massiliense]